MSQPLIELHNSKKNSHERVYSGDFVYIKIKDNRMIKGKINTIQKDYLVIKQDTVSYTNISLIYKNLPVFYAHLLILLSGNCLFLWAKAFEPFLLLNLIEIPVLLIYLPKAGIFKYDLENNSTLKYIRDKKTTIPVYR